MNSIVKVNILDDFPKAFDSVDHPFTKFKGHNSHVKSFYMCNNTRLNQVEGPVKCISTVQLLYRTCEEGVAQGKVLGPRFFNTYDFL